MPSILFLDASKHPDVTARDTRFDPMLRVVTHSVSVTTLVVFALDGRLPTAAAAASCYVIGTVIIFVARNRILPRQLATS